MKLTDAQAAALREVLRFALPVLADAQRLTERPEAETDYDTVSTWADDLTTAARKLTVLADELGAADEAVLRCDHVHADRPRGRRCELPRGHAEAHKAGAVRWSR